MSLPESVFITFSDPKGWDFNSRTYICVEDIPPDMPDCQKYIKATECTWVPDPKPPYFAIPTYTTECSVKPKSKYGDYCQNCGQLIQVYEED